MREGLCCADEADRHKGRASHKRHVCGAPVPRTVPVDSSLRKDRDRLSCIKCLPHPHERELVAAATLNPDRTEPVERLRE